MTSAGQDMLDDLVPAASIQERMWFAERLEPGVGRYNVPHAWRVHGRLSPALLEQALALVIQRHEILRTAFVERDGRLFQQVRGAWTPELERVDLRGVPAAEDELRTWLRDAARRPIEPGASRLLRVGLVDLPRGEQVLFLCVHHLVWDAASTPLFLRELRSCYARAEAAAGDDAPAQPPRSTASFDDGGPIPRLPR